MFTGNLGASAYTEISASAVHASLLALDPARNRGYLCQESFLLLF